MRDCKNNINNIIYSLKLKIYQGFIIFINCVFILFGGIYNRFIGLGLGAPENLLHTHTL